MQLTDKTIKILENFSSITSGIVIRKTTEGGTKTLLRTVNRASSIYAQTLMDEILPTNVCLYELKPFLDIISSSDDPDIEFNDNNLTITSGNSSANITYTDAAYITHPDGDFNIPETDVEFELSQTDIANILNKGNILSLPSLRVFTRDDKILIQACDKHNPNTSTFEIMLGDSSGADFDVYIKQENLKMLPGDYNVKVAVDRIAIFTNAVITDLFYGIALDNS